MAVLPLGKNSIPSSWGYLVGSGCRKQLLKNTAIFVNTDKVGTNVPSGVMSRMDTGVGVFNYCLVACGTVLLGVGAALR